jgi:hypothetical protein
MAGKSPLTDEQWQAIHTRVLAGESTGEIDRELGFSKGAVTKALKRKFGRTGRAIKKPMTQQESDEALKRVLAGESPSAICRDYGFSHNGNMYKMLERRYGYKPSDIRKRTVWAPTIKLDHASNTDLAYLAGIIDGEGSIMQIFRTRKHPVWAIKCNMTDRPIIEWLHSFGGTFHIRPSRDPGRFKEQYEWDMHRQLDVQAMLTALLPYLRVKHDKAKAALKSFEDSPFLMDGGNLATAQRDDSRAELAYPPKVYPLGSTTIAVADYCT